MTASHNPNQEPRHDKVAPGAATEQQLGYVDVFLTIDWSNGARGFAFGIMQDGSKRKVFVSSRAFSIRKNGGWEKSSHAVTPEPGEPIWARVSLQQQPGKELRATNWCFWGSDDYVDDGEDEPDYLGEHLQYCDGCTYCNPTAFRPMH